MLRIYSFSFVALVFFNVCFETELFFTISVGKNCVKTFHILQVSMRNISSLYFIYLCGSVTFMR